MNERLDQKWRGGMVGSPIPANAGGIFSLYPELQGLEYLQCKHRSRDYSTLRKCRWGHIANSVALVFFLSFYVFICCSYFSLRGGEGMEGREEEREVRKKKNLSYQKRDCSTSCEIQNSGECVGRVQICI